MYFIFFPDNRTVVQVWKRNPDGKDELVEEIHWELVSSDLKEALKNRLEAGLRPGG